MISMFHVNFSDIKLNFVFDKMMKQIGISSKLKNQVLNYNHSNRSMEGIKIAYISFIYFCNSICDNSYYIINVIRNIKR